MFCFTFNPHNYLITINQQLYNDECNFNSTSGSVSSVYSRSSSKTRQRLENEEDEVSEKAAKAAKPDHKTTSLQSKLQAPVAAILSK